MPTPYSPGAGRLKPELRRHFLEKLVRRLHEDARAVAGVGLAAARAAMVEVQQHLQRLLDNGVRLFALHVDDKADAAGVVLELRIVKPLLWRWRCPRPLAVI